jgi:hypothetical protein
MIPFHLFVLLIVLRHFESTACYKYTADFFSPVLYTVLFLKEFLQPAALLFSHPLSPLSHEKEDRRIQPSATASPQRRQSGSKRRAV